MLYGPEDLRDLIFYLKPKKKWSPGDDIWFERNPIGHNMLNTRFTKMCGEAGLVGNFTNHSWRATAITRMFDAGLPEKSIMQRSGHRSIEGSGHIREKTQITRLSCRMFCRLQIANCLVLMRRVQQSVRRVVLVITLSYFWMMIRIIKC